MSNEKSKVYFVENLETGLIKIKYDFDSDSVVNKIKPKGLPLEVKKAIAGDLKLEKIFSKYFRDSRYKGTWFKPDQEMTQFLSGKKISVKDVVKTTSSLLTNTELDFLLARSKEGYL